jgi:hypothetical protein
MEMRTLAVVFALTVLGTACDSDSPTALGDGPFEIESVVEVSQSGYTDPQRATIRTADEWAQAWATLHAGLQPVPARPPIDFETTVVVLAALGTRPNGCYSIDIAGVQSSIEGQPVFDVVETQPGPNCVCTEALTRPAHAVRIARFSGEAEFLERVAELRC